MPSCDMHPEATATNRVIVPDVYGGEPIEYELCEVCTTEQENNAETLGLEITVIPLRTAPVPVVESAVVVPGEHHAGITPAEWENWQRRTRELQGRLRAIAATTLADHPLAVLANESLDLTAQVVTAGSLNASLESPELIAARREIEELQEALRQSQRERVLVEDVEPSRLVKTNLRVVAQS